MQLVHVYLNFPGTAEEAFQHYEKVFGTRVIAKMTYDQAPWVQNKPEAAKGKIMHAQLPVTETTHLMGCDAVEGMCPVAYQSGNNVHVSIVAKDQAEADRAFELLSAGGKVTTPLANAPWGPYFGMCTDRFGVQWMVSLPQPA